MSPSVPGLSLSDPLSRCSSEGEPRHPDPAAGALARPQHNRPAHRQWLRPHPVLRSSRRLDFTLPVLQLRVPLPVSEDFSGRLKARCLESNISLESRTWVVAWPPPSAASHLGFLSAITVPRLHISHRPRFMDCRSPLFLVTGSRFISNISTFPLCPSSRVPFSFLFHSLSVAQTFSLPRA